MATTLPCRNRRQQHWQERSLAIQLIIYDASLKENLFTLDGEAYASYDHDMPHWMNHE